MRDKLVALLERDDLPSDLQDVADVIGMDAMRLLIEHFDGERFYIPSLRYLKLLYERYIVAHYREHGDGTNNLRQLRRDLNVGPDYIREILRRKGQARRAE